MPEVVAQYKVDVSQAVKSLDEVAAKTKTLDQDFVKGSSGAKRLNDEIAKTPQTLTELELKLSRLKELLKDDTNIGTKGFKAVQDEIKKTEKAIDKANGKLEETGKQGNNIISTFKKVAGVLGVAFGVQQIIQFGKEAVKLAAQGEGIRRAFAKLNDPNLLSNLRKATRGTVTDVQLMQSAIRAKNFQVPIEKLATFFEFATKRSIETGESVDYLVNSIVDGIGRKSTLVLDNLGISATELQAEIKKTGDFGEAAANIISRGLAETGDVADTTAVKIAALSASFQNFKEAVGQDLIKQLGGLNDQVSDVGENLGTEEIDAFGVAMFFVSNAVEALLAPFTTLAWIVNKNAELFNWIKGLFGETAEEIENYSNITEDAERATRMMADALGEGMVKEIQNTVISINLLNKQLKDYKDELNDAEIGSRAYFDIVSKIVAKTKELNEAIALTKLDEALKVDSDAEFLITPVVDTTVIDPISELEREWEKMFSESDWPDILQGQIDEMVESGLASLDRLSAQWKETQDEWKRMRVEQQQANRDYFDSIVSSWQTVTQIAQQLTQAQYDNQLDQLRTQLEAGAITQEQYDSRRRSLARKQAEEQKELAIFQAILNTAIGVTNAIATAPNIILGLILAAVAGAAGAAEIAVISSQPVPTFKDGGKVSEHGILKGKTHTQGGIHIEAEANEYFMPTKPTSKYYAELEAMRKGTYENLIMAKYVQPVLDDAIFTGWSDIGQSAALNGITANLKDHNLIAAIDRDRQTTANGFKFLARELKGALKSKNRDRYA